MTSKDIAAAPAPDQSQTAARAEKDAPLTPAQVKALDRDHDGHAGGSLSAAKAASSSDPAPEKTTYIITRHSDGYGAKGTFADLTEVEASAGKSSGILRVPTAEELSRRRP